MYEGHKIILLDENCVIPNCHQCGKEMSLFCFDKETIQRMLGNHFYGEYETGMLKYDKEQDHYIYPICSKCVPMIEG
jgi:hypothetical protein